MYRVDEIQSLAFKDDEKIPATAVLFRESTFTNRTTHDSLESAPQNSLPVHEKIKQRYSLECTLFVDNVLFTQ